MNRNCKIHGNTAHSVRKDGGSRCRKCQVISVTKRRRKVKRSLVQEAGGKCTKCGYSKSVAALHFHHKKEKSFGISASGFTRGIDILRKEIKKCVLLCANCHAEEHSVG